MRGMKGFLCELFLITTIHSSEVYSSFLSHSGTDFEIGVLNLEKLPKQLILLGTLEDTIYFQDTILRNQREAREYCPTVAKGVTLATFANQQHLEFIISKGALDYSWTDWSSEYTRDIYKWGNGAAISDNIPIAHYDDLGLRIGTGNASLISGQSHLQHPTICSLYLNPIDLKYNSLNNSSGYKRTNNQIAANRSSPLQFIGSYDHCMYWQYTVHMGQTPARLYCESLGMTLVRLPSKNHVDYLCFEGALDGSWTDGVVLLTRDTFRSTNGTEVPADILVDQEVNLALKLDTSVKGLVADVANSVGASICYIQTAG